MTVEELNQRIKQGLSLGEILKAFIPGDVDDRIIEYVAAVLEDNHRLQSLLVEDIFGGSDGPFMASREILLGAAGEDPQSMDPATLMLLIQIGVALAKAIAEMRRRRREQ